MSAATEHAHPGPKQYAIIAFVLTTITLLEFWAFYIPWLREVGMFMPILIVLSVIKFVLVAMFYMHLKYDTNVFTRLLLTGLGLATGTMLALLGFFFLSHPPGA